MQVIAGEWCLAFSVCLSFHLFWWLCLHWHLLHFLGVQRTLFTLSVGLLCPLLACSLPFTDWGQGKQKMILCFSSIIWVLLFALMFVFLPLFLHSSNALLHCCYICTLLWTWVIIWLSDLCPHDHACRCPLMEVWWRRVMTTSWQSVGVCWVLVVLLTIGLLCSECICSTLACSTEWICCSTE